MSTPKRAYALMVLLLLMAAASVSASVGFAVPPTFAPQRMILWNFTDPQTWQTPITATGPTWDEGDWICDNVTFSGDLQWIDTNSNWAGRQGMLGIVNNTDHNLSGSVTFHINNYATLNPLKLMAMEYQWRGVPNSSIETRVSVPEGFAVTSGNWTHTSVFPGERVDWAGTLAPNPSWEEVRLTLSAQPGGAIFLDSFYVATRCVPEPSSLLALSSGLLGIAGLVIRKRGR